jgi:hypothetical protein
LKRLFRWKEVGNAGESVWLCIKKEKMVEAGIPVHGVGFQCHERSVKKAPDLFTRCLIFRPC